MQQTSNIPTPRQQELYEFIRDQIYEQGYGPTVRELCERFDIHSPNGAVSHLKALQKKGYIERRANRSRAIRLLKDPTHPSRLPIVARVSGRQISMLKEVKDHCNTGGMFTASKAGSLAAVEVKGDALVSEHVVSGDCVIVDREANPRKGQTVLLTIEDGVSLRRWVPERGGNVRLEPVHGSAKPVTVKSPEIVGVVVGVIRRVGK
ncbi:MAG: transcriptional repressor LexA [Planctomycetia bacterium]|nr:transcriptional repressor LexA [Planctomycetia bacterium]